MSNDIKKLFQLYTGQILEQTFTDAQKRVKNESRINNLFNSYCLSKSFDEGKVENWNREAHQVVFRGGTEKDRINWISKVINECAEVLAPLALNEYPILPGSDMFGLKGTWWKAVIDFKCHKHGCLVFDYGLHNENQVEPGFLKSIYKAYYFVAKELKDCPKKHPSKEFYLEIHKQATQHVHGGSEISGNVRDYEVFAFVPFASFPIPKKFTENQQKYFDLLLAEFHGGDLPINKSVSLIFQSNDQPHNTGVTLQYVGTKEGIEEALAQLLTTFKEKMTTLEDSTQPDREATLRLIASLFQKLEWLHPFKDGQGRTDLVFLNYLLVRYGFTPAILEETYLASIVTLDDWVQHLKEGMARWQEEKGKMDGGGSSSA